MTVPVAAPYADRDCDRLRRDPVRCRRHPRAARPDGARPAARVLRRRPVDRAPRPRALPRDGGEERGRAAARRSGTSTTSRTSSRSACPARPGRVRRARARPHPQRATCGGGRSPRASTRCARCDDAGVPIGVVSNASGQIEEVLRRSGVCQVGDGSGCTQCGSSSTATSSASPSPTRASSTSRSTHFDGIERSADRLRRRLGHDGHRGGRAAGLHPILLDPYDDHPDADFPRIRSLQGAARDVGSRQALAPP